MAKYVLETERRKAIRLGLQDLSERSFVAKLDTSAGNLGFEFFLVPVHIRLTNDAYEMGGGEAKELFKSV